MLSVTDVYICTQAYTYTHTDRTWPKETGLFQSSNNKLGSFKEIIIIEICRRNVNMGH